MQALRLASLLLFCSMYYFSTQAQAQPQQAQADTSQIQIPAAQKINLNSADVATLTHAFKGIGKKRAEAIVHYREEQGQFKSVEDLAYVRGLGALFVKRNLALLETIFIVG